MLGLAYRTATLRNVLNIYSPITFSHMPLTARYATNNIHNGHSVTNASHDDIYLPFDQPDTVGDPSTHSLIQSHRTSHVKRAGDFDGIVGNKVNIIPKAWKDGSSQHNGGFSSRSLTSVPNDGYTSPPQTYTTSTSDNPDTVARITSESTLRPDRLKVSMVSDGDGLSARSLPRSTKDSVAQKREAKPGSVPSPSNTPQSKRNHRQSPATKREAWQIQKDALATKFGSAGWSPRKRLSPDALEGIRALHKQFPEKYSTPVLADQFEVSAESIRRILKSKWRPSNDEATRRRQRWDNRGERIWNQMVALGVKPPKKWRDVSPGFHLFPGLRIFPKVEARASTKPIVWQSICIFEDDMC